MVTAILFGCMLCIYLICYLMNIMMPWELIAPALMAIPIWMYAKREKGAWCRLWSTFALFMGARVAATSVVARSYPDKVSLPITFEQDIIKGCCGAISIATWNVWLIICAIQMICTVIYKCKHSESSEELNGDHTIRRGINIFAMTALFCLVLHTLAIFGYSLTSVWKSLVMQCIIVIVFSVICFRWVMRAVKDKINEFMRKDMIGG